jgi:hypothetical protein
MNITKDTKVYEILRRYGDIADVMEAFGIKRVGRYSARLLVARLITVEQAARIHRVPVDDLLAMLHKAVALKGEPANERAS